MAVYSMTGYASASTGARNAYETGTNDNGQTARSAGSGAALNVCLLNTTFASDDS